MSDKFYRIPVEKLFKWILNEEKEGRIFGIYKELFFTPKITDVFRIQRYGKTLETPIGVAAGPHTQLAQNIILSWLCGARYIELKTVQTLDEIDVRKPCIDMEDEGYNCEWSQELKVEDSFDEYLNAWIIIHILKNKFGWDEDEPGFIFNMSVGYDYAGIRNTNVQWFLDKMSDCKKEKGEKIEKLASLYSKIRDIKIPDMMSDNITLSTMHGCPSDEIEKICKYLIEERKLHTSLKLNPTLLGKDTLRDILSDKLGYNIAVPEEAFEHDLKYDDAVRIIHSLSKSADDSGVKFGLKLTNTLEAVNSTNWIPGSEELVYASGRALHPISITLAEKFQNDFKGELDISFSAGIDAFNAADTIACNLKPITVCTDLLKPGGYLRLIQYLEEIDKAISGTGSDNIEEFTRVKGNSNDLCYAGLQNLKNYASAVVENKNYKKSSFRYKNIKTKRLLTLFDCIHAPCIEECAVYQNVPEYMYHTANGNYDKAFESILKENPLPNMTGCVCDHLCQAKCTRINYDNPLLIREIKRFIAERNTGAAVKSIEKKNGLRATVIGAGPSGLSCAYFLALHGFEVNVYESKSMAGGMVSGSIPHFRLNDKSVETDIEIMKSSGVQFHYNRKVDEALFSELLKKNNYLYIGIGAQKSKQLNIPGEELSGVTDQLSYLSNIRRQKNEIHGKKVAVIGGGLSAIDAARTAMRLAGEDGRVIMIYRRTKTEMPAGQDEIDALISEGVELLELTAPISIQQDKDEMLSVKFVRMQLQGTDDSGRPKPVPVTGSEYSLIFDSIITAIGQDIDLDFLDQKIFIDNETGETQISGIFAGGDAIRGADSLINALGDGKKAAHSIIKKSKIEKKRDDQPVHKLSPSEYQKKLARREYGIPLPEIALENRKGFDLVHPVLDEASAVKEAQRCLYCNDICNICVSVCPNLANIDFTVDPVEIPVYHVSNNNGSPIVKIENYFNITQKNQIITIANFCNECGNCNTFCPTSGSPYKTKALFYLTEESFENESAGYYYEDKVLKYKNNNVQHILCSKEDYYEYTSGIVNARFRNNDFKLMEINFNTTSVDEVELYQAAEMYFLIKNILNISLFKN
jgi:putative selenate reductase